MKGTLSMKKHGLKDSDLVPIVASTQASIYSGFSKLYFAISDDTLIIKEKPTSAKPMHRLPFAKMDNFGVNSATDTMYFVGFIKPRPSRTISG